MYFLVYVEQNFAKKINLQTQANCKTKKCVLLDLHTRIKKICVGALQLFTKIALMPCLALTKRLQQQVSKMLLKNLKTKNIKIKPK